MRKRETGREQAKPSVTLNPPPIQDGAERSLAGEEAAKVGHHGRRVHAQSGNTGNFTGFTCRHIKSRRCRLDAGRASLETSCRRASFISRVDRRASGFCSLVILNHNGANVWARGRAKWMDCTSVWIITDCLWMCVGMTRRL